jgi:ABC-2 type transport system permease protein
MTATDVRPAAPAQPTPSLAVRAWALLLSEWTKFWSVRSTFWTLLVMVITPILLGDLLAVIFAQPSSGPPSDPLLPAFFSLEYAALAACVLGVMQFSSEFSTGLIRTTFISAPRRRAVLAAKAVVTGAITFVASEITAFVSFFLTQAILRSHHQGVSWSHPGVPGAVVANGTVLFVCVMLALAMGAIVRHTAGGIAATVALIALPSILGLLPAPWGARIGRFTLINAAQQVTVLHPNTNQFSPGLSMIVLLAWPVIALLIATVTIGRAPT